MKKYLLLLVAACCAAVAMGQSWSQIKTSPKYYWGESTRPDQNQAFKEALEQLSSSISVSLSSDTQLINSGTTQNDTKGNSESSAKSEFRNVINVYTQATVDGLQKFVNQDGKNWHVCLYTPKARIDTVFQQRRQQIESLVDNARRNVELAKLDVALKDFYWAYALLRSLPTTTTEKYPGESTNLSVYLPGVIDEILSDIKITPKNIDGLDMEFDFMYKGRPVSSLDFYCIEGGQLGPLTSAGEGVGEVSLIDEPTNGKLEFEIEYKYADQATDAGLKSILRQIPPVSMKHCIKYVPLKGAPKELATVAPTPVAPKNPTATVKEVKDIAIDSNFAPDPVEIAKETQPTEMANALDYQQKIARLMQCLETKASPNTISDMMTPEGLKRYKTILRNGQAKVVDSHNLHFWNTPRGEVTCRGAIMTFKFRTGRYRSFTRDVVFTFDKEGKISNIGYSVGATPREDIMSLPFPEAARHNIMQFIENYQTAYALKDSVYLDAVFDDNAIIITGTVVQAPKGHEDYMYKDDTRIIYNRPTKDQYLGNLKKVFRAREYVNLRFNNIRVAMCDDQTQTYGIMMEQDYFTPTYFDHGYLYIQVSLKDQDRPNITVRTWQPKPDEKFGLFNESDFPIHQTLD